ncbi:MAG: hypothetical protein HQ461_15925 [Deltaproteobacteria bacterium]|nr:hypothetical protein [Deltaproteobacteria bacterium]
MSGKQPPKSTDETPDDATRLRERLESLFPERLRRRVTSTGEVGAAIGGEVLRSVVGDLKLPREAVHYMLAQADATKREVVRVAANEFRDFLETANLGDEVAKVLTKLSFEIRTEIRFVPNDAAFKPAVTSRVRVVDTAEAEQAKPGESVASSVLEEVIRGAAQEFADRVLGRRGKGEEPAAATPPAQPAVPAAAAVPEALEAPKTRTRRKRTGGATG